MNRKNPHEQDFRFSLFMALLTVLAFALTRLGLFHGMAGTDDFSIARNAIRLLEQGPYLPDGHYSARIGLIYPLALIFRLFGVGEYQMAAIPLLASALGIHVAYLIGRHYGGSRLGWLAAFTLALFPLDAYFSSELMPDLPLGTLLGWSFYLLLRSGERGKVSLAFVAGLLWGWGYLVKVEAFFFVFVVLAMLLFGQLALRNMVYGFLGVGLVVGLENLVYYLASGVPFLRVHLAAVQGGGKMVAEYSATQLWVFPKAWFLTPYYFGLHYYLLFFSIFWVAARKDRVMGPMAVWAVVYLLWLQFGGNPFSDSYSVKSHLDRYCLMINVPMAVLIARMVHQVSKRVKWLTPGYVAALVLVALVFMPFNQLSAERQFATKRLLDTARSENLFPLYLDRVSESLAEIYLYPEHKAGKLHSLQHHDFRKMETELVPPERIDGYVLINRGFVDYGYNRYRVQKVTEEMMKPRFRVYRRSDNPMPAASYASARLLRFLAGFIPVEGIRNKVRHTAEYLLEGKDAVLMVPAGDGETERARGARPTK